MSSHATTVIKAPATKTPLDYMAEGYWQDFLAQRATAGGVVYEQQLQACQLDESLLSLQRIDILISQIRRDIIKSDKLSEASVLADERYRNLFVFLAFYAGRVLAGQGHYIPNWYGQFELAKRYPDLPIVEDDFYQHMAVVYYNNIDNVESSDRALSALFFALEPIGQRLFGNVDRQFLSVQGEPVASGLYQAVLERLPETVVNENLKTKRSDARNVNDKRLVNDDLRVKDSIATFKSSDDNDSASQSVANKALVEESIIGETETVSIKPGINKQASCEMSAQESASQQFTVTTNKPVAPMPEIFIQLLAELNSIEVAQTNGNEDYNQACKTLDQFERHIARQKIARSEVVFSPAHQQQRQQALIKLQNAASVGHTGAMLRLAMYELLGEGLTADNYSDKKASKEAGVELVKQAANANDSRGQRLLSRLYYKGFGVTQDMQSGKHWLEQAAKNGHSEAASLVTQWQQAEMLMTTRQQEQHSTKRYQLLIVVVIIAAVALIVFV